MQKVLLLIDCDWCRTVYEHVRMASDDTTAWDHHGHALVQRACTEDGWSVSDCGNFHYCPNCADEVEKICFALSSKQQSADEETPETIDF
jgi:hypothetical protein